MEKNNNGNGNIELWGREFKRSKQGIDEKQIVSFVNDIIGERDTLLRRQEHLSSLTELAERMVSEADNISQKMKEEAVDKAKTEVDTIITQAEEQARQMFEDKKAEASAKANEEAESIKANARKQAEYTLNEQTMKVQSDFNEIAQLLFSEHVSQLETLKQQVNVAQADFEQRLSQSTPVQPLGVPRSRHRIAGWFTGGPCLGGRAWPNRERHPLYPQPADRRGFHLASQKTS